MLAHSIAKAKAEGAGEGWEQQRQRERNKWHNDNCHAVYPCSIKELNECIKNKLFESDFHNFLCINSVLTVWLTVWFSRLFQWRVECSFGCAFHCASVSVCVCIHIVNAHKNTLFIVFGSNLLDELFVYLLVWYEVQSGWLSAHFLYFYLSISFVCVCVYVRALCHLSVSLLFRSLRAAHIRYIFQCLFVYVCWWLLLFFICPFFVLDRFNNRYFRKKKNNKCAAKARNRKQWLQQ